MAQGLIEDVIGTREKRAGEKRFDRGRKEYPGPTVGRGWRRKEQAGGSVSLKLSRERGAADYCNNCRETASKIKFGFAIARETTWQLG